ncbi:unnamed protein product [Somion occarium]|uniref:T6SS Phospholipase effector Tle1-like catalytic domain-containing protein n=1 Tax=Somion occarium TaxID=3059160 RepID=A0ABP1CEV4_9APHY
MSQSQYVPVLSSSPSVYTQIFEPQLIDSALQRAIDLSNVGDRSNVQLPKLSSAASGDSEITCVGQEHDWGEKKRSWITAQDAAHVAPPSSPRQRTLVLCFDGTGDQFDEDNSNVVQFLSMLKKDDNTQQLVYYQMLAWNLPSHVKDGYAFLMQNYTHGDKICIFGFSRGAYTARALAGMLHKVGLLPIHNHQQLPFAYEMYAREDEEGLKLSHMFKKTFCRAVTIEFLGVWDTVASVGVIPRYLPFIHENSGIRYLRHALALDERRVKFLPQFCVDNPKKKPKHEKHMLFHRKKPKRALTLTKAYEDLINRRNAVDKTDVKEVWFAGVHTDVGGGSVPNGTPHSLARIPLRWMIRECFRCNNGILFDAVQLQQVGLRVTTNDNGDLILGDIPARIKVYSPRNVPRPKNPKYRNGCGSLFFRVAVKFASESLSYSLTTLKQLFWSERRTLISLVPPGSGPLAYLDSSDGSELVGQPEDYEAREELEDALSPFYDQLEARATWHILEWIPQRIKTAKAIIHKMDDNGYTWLWNRGQGRRIPRSEMKEGLKIHRSVKTRLEASGRLGAPYIPHVRPELKVINAEGRKVKVSRQLRHEEWNVESPVHWEWVE